MPVCCLCTLRRVAPLTYPSPSRICEYSCRVTQPLCSISAAIATTLGLGPHESGESTCDLRLRDDARGTEAREIRIKIQAKVAVSLDNILLCRLDVHLARWKWRDSCTPKIPDEHARWKLPGLGLELGVQALLRATERAVTARPKNLKSSPLFRSHTASRPVLWKLNDP